MTYLRSMTASDTCVVSHVMVKLLLCYLLVNDIHCRVY